MNAAENSIGIHFRGTLCEPFSMVWTDNIGPIFAKHFHWLPEEDSSAVN